MKTKLTVLISILLLLITNCTKIEITEDDAFDAHRTITPATFNISTFDMEEIRLETSDGETLDAWFLSREDAVATVVYFGGNGALMVKSRPLIQAYTSVPVNLLLFDYRGYGLSTGEPTVMGIYEDARTAFNYAQNDAPVQTDKIYVHGHSMGSFLSAMIADENRVDGYILESPVTEVDQWTKRMVPWVLRLFVRFNIDDDVKAQNNSERVSRIQTPLLIIGGTGDDVTPIRMAEELYDQSASEQKRLVRISGGSHNNLPNSSAYREALIQFIQ